MHHQLTVFRTDLGWIGLLGAESRVERLLMGHAAADEVRERLARDFNAGWSESNWWPELKQRLIDYTRGAVDDFRDVSVESSVTTPFGRRVIAALRRVRYGETVSYGELASRAGTPGAARAVGSVMRRNTVPLIVPCHRVIAAGGKLGGFSAPQGVSLKQRLLDLEAAH
ncbi:MAG: MGMT family protein [Planctomycetaceae bacterium]